MKATVASDQNSTGLDLSRNSLHHQASFAKTKLPAHPGARYDHSDGFADQPINRSKLTDSSKCCRFLLKLSLTAACLWYAFRSISAADFIRLAHTTNLSWAAFSVLVMLIQIPLVGLRWCKIVDDFAADGRRVPRLPLMTITAIGAFLWQVGPNVVGDGMRVWLLKRVGRSWREGLVSVLIDRGVGVGMLLAITFCALLFPSGLIAIGGYHGIVVALIGGLFTTGLAAVVLAPLFAPILARWRFIRWVGVFALTSYEILLRRPSGRTIVAIAALAHAVTIISIWLLGREQGLELSVMDAVVLFAVMSGIAMIPLTVGGWGLHELAVATLLQSHGVPLDRALFFSVSFGLAGLLASSLGAIVWAIYTPVRTAVSS